MKTSALKISFVFIFLITSFLFINSPKEKRDNQSRSSSLSRSVETKSNEERIDYTDEDGNITIAADLGYSTKKTTRTQTGTITAFYDPDGNPIERYPGYYAIKQEYNEDGKIWRNVFLGIDGEPTILAIGYTFEEHILDDTEKIETVHFYDIHGVVVCSATEGYGKRIEYNTNGTIAKITYLDKYDNPLIVSKGYAIITYTYYPDESAENRKVENEFYFDPEGKPIKLSLGQYGIHKEYDEKGENNSITYLNSEGQTIESNKGYSTVVTEYWGNYKTEMYFDLDGRPFKLPEGQYGIKEESGKTTYLNEKGEEIFNLRNGLYNQSFYAVLAAIVVILISAGTNKQWNVALLVSYCGFIVYITLMYRTKRVSNTSFDLFETYKQLFIDAEMRSSILRNVWLFIPLGAILFKLYPSKTILIFPVLFSIIIEGYQYFSGTGLCELADVINNGLGAIIGYCTGKLISGIRQNLVLIYKKQKNQTNKIGQC